MMLGTWYLLPAETRSIWGAILGCERVCGVHPAITIVKEVDENGSEFLALAVTAYHEVHRKELFDPQPFVVPLWDTDQIRMELQMIAAVQGWLFHVERHIAQTSQ